MDNSVNKNIIELEQELSKHGGPYYFAYHLVVQGSPEQQLPKLLILMSTSAKLWISSNADFNQWLDFAKATLRYEQIYGFFLLLDAARNSLQLVSIEEIVAEALADARNHPDVSNNKEASNASN